MIDLPVAVWIGQHLILCQLFSILVIGLELLFTTGLIWKRTLPFWLEALWEKWKTPPSTDLPVASSSHGDRADDE